MPCNIYMWKLRAKWRHLYLSPSSNCIFEPRHIQSAPHWLTQPTTLIPNQGKAKKILCFTTFFNKWIAPQGVLHPPYSENVFLHVLNRRSSFPAPPSLLLSLWHDSSRACFNVSHDEDDKSLMAGKRRLKNGLNYPHCRGYVSSRCVVFIAVMFTFISTCLKCVSLFPLALTRRPLLIFTRLCSANRCYQAKKMFCLLSISKAQGPVKTLLVRVHGRYCNFKRVKYWHVH